MSTSTWKSGSKTKKGHDGRLGNVVTSSRTNYTSGSSRLLGQSQLTGGRTQYTTGSSSRIIGGNNSRVVTTQKTVTSNYQSSNGKMIRR